MASERLDKRLASTGRWSRKEVKELIRQGRVRVDCVPAARPEDRVEEGSAILVDGQEVDCAPFVYLMLHKPAGLLSAGSVIFAASASYLRSRACPFAWTAFW